MSLRNTANYLGLKTLATVNDDTKMTFCKDYTNATYTFTIASSFSGTIKFYQSNQEARPDLDAVASVTNKYSTVQVINLATATALNGDTGFVATGSSDGVLEFKVNIDSANWIGVALTAVAAGNVVVDLALSDNN